MSRSIFSTSLNLFAVVLIAGFFCPLRIAAKESQPPATQPNIVLFLVDDMGVMDSSVPFLTDDQQRPKRYPLNDFYRTPNMEELARRGIRFSNFHAMSVCSPTRISLMTGQNAARHRTTNWINPDQNNRGPKGPNDWNWQGLTADNQTLPKLLQSKGYRTIHIGKGHFGPRKSEGAQPTNLGFDISVGGASIGAPGSYFGEKSYGLDGPRPSAAVPGLQAYHRSDVFLTEALTREALKHVTAAVQQNRPFFLYFAHYAVHAPFDSDPRFAANYANSGKPAQAQAFATLIEGMDRSLGDLLKHLDDQKVAENTLIFFLGDNGSDAPLGGPHEVACAAPLRGKKGSHYEGGTRVPMLAAWARPNESLAFQARIPIRANAIQSQLAAVYDLFPTILDVALVSLQEGGPIIDGRSLGPLLTGKQDGTRGERFLMHYPHAPHRSDYFTVWRDGPWKLIYHYFPEDTSARYELFDLASDPFEQHDLSRSRPDKLKLMVEDLVQQLDAHQALLPAGASLLIPSAN
jgi:arylsulfatase A-like enzyme